VPLSWPDDANGRCLEQQEKIMNKTTNKAATHNDGLDGAGLPLEDHELDSVSGGGIKGDLKGVCTQGGGEGQGGQNDPAQMFQQILQQLTQG